MYKNRLKSSTESKLGQNMLSAPSAPPAGPAAHPGPHRRAQVCVHLAVSWAGLAVSWPRLPAKSQPQATVSQRSCRALCRVVPCAYACPCRAPPRAQRLPRPLRTPVPRGVPLPRACAPVPLHAHPACSSARLCVVRPQRPACCSCLALSSTTETKIFNLFFFFLSIISSSWKNHLKIIIIIIFSFS